MTAYDPTNHQAAIPGEWAEHPDRPCNNPDLSPRQRDRIWFPARGESTAIAKALCNQCPVKDDCLDFALTNSEKYGIWGGTSERERRRIRHRRVAA